MPYHGLSKLSYPFDDRTITVTQCICINEATRALGCSVNTTALVESNRAIAVSSIHVFIRLGPAFEVEDWYARSGGGVIFCL